jgi:hypothetical protein
MTHIANGARSARLFSCWPSRLGVLALSALAMIWTLDAIAPGVI